MSELHFYTAAEVATLLRLNHQVVQRKLQAGEIPGYRLGKEWRVERSQLLSWLERHSNQRSGVSRTLATFTAEDGRLSALPASREKRAVVLGHIAATFPPDRRFTEREISDALRAFHDDVATLRRELVATKLFVRTTDGVYKRAVPREPVLRRA